MDQVDIEQLSFEAALAELEQIVRTLEQGQAPLDESIELYQRGDRLKRHCEARLKAAQARIEQGLLQALHQALDDLRLLLREAAVDDQHVGDDQQVAVGGQDVGLSAAAAHHLRDLRLPRHAPGELVLA